MKRIKYFFTAIAFGILASMASCVSDDGNYDYLSDEQAGEIKFDTVGMDPCNAPEPLCPLKRTAYRIHS